MFRAVADIVIDPGPRTTGQVDDRVIAFAGRQAAVFFLVVSFLIFTPAGIQLDEVKLYETGIRVLTVLRNFKQSALDITRLVIDLAFERTDNGIDTVAVTRKKIRRFLGMRS